MSASPASPTAPAAAATAASNFLTNVPQGFHLAIEALNTLPNNIVSDIADKVIETISGSGSGNIEDEYFDKVRFFLSRSFLTL